MGKFILRMVLGGVIIGVFYGAYDTLRFECAKVEAAQTIGRFLDVEREILLEEREAQQAKQKLSRFKQEARVALAVGIAMEEFGKAAPREWISKPVFMVMHQAGVQIQIAAMEDLGMISNNPAIAGVQGFLVGL